jgi:hypothetical protein
MMFVPVQSLFSTDLVNMTLARREDPRTHGQYDENA